MRLLEECMRNIKTQPLRGFVLRIFPVSQNNTNEEIGKFEHLINLPMNGLFGQCIRKVIDITHDIKTENWMRTRKDDRAEDYHEQVEVVM